MRVPGSAGFGPIRNADPQRRSIGTESDPAGRMTVESLEDGDIVDVDVDTIVNRQYMVHGV